MFLNNYLPRSANIEKSKSLKYIKFGLMFFFFATILITFTFSIKDKSKMVLKDEILHDTFSKNKNLLKVENAKLIGNDKNNKPYVITAASSFKKNFNKNMVFLYSVEVDITLKDNSWMLLHTDYAAFNVLNKVISADEKVLIFYDNGTELESTQLKYNISEGTGHGSNGVKMLGEWGIIEANSFSFDINNQKIRFFDNPKLTLN